MVGYWVQTSPTILVKIRQLLEWFHSELSYPRTLEILVGTKQIGYKAWNSQSSTRDIEEALWMVGVEGFYTLTVWTEADGIFWIPAIFPLVFFSEQLPQT